MNFVTERDIKKEESGSDTESEEMKLESQWECPNCQDANKLVEHYIQCKGCGEYRTVPFPGQTTGTNHGSTTGHTPVTHTDRRRSSRLTSLRRKDR